MAARCSAGRGTGTASTCATGAAQPIGTDLRDELIAIEHAARHYN
jgi:hypothetical protein